MPGSDDLTAELDRIAERGYRKGTAPGLMAGYLADHAADDIPRLLAALRAVLELADSAAPHVAISGTKRYLAPGRTLDPAEVREAITRKITGKGESGGA